MGEGSLTIGGVGLMEYRPLAAARGLNSQIPKPSARGSDSVLLRPACHLRGIGPTRELIEGAGFEVEVE
jgi:hypothetical protein